MAKIKKMTFETGKMPEVSTNSLLEDVNAEIEQKEKKNLTAEVVDIKTKVIDKDIQAKLDSCAQIEAQNAFLLKEKAELEARLAEYIEENASLKNASKTTEAGNDNELANLKKEIAELKESIAQYLRRISDLTFENANLTVQLKELSSAGTGVQNSTPAVPRHETRLEHPVYDPYKQNGYSSWN